MKHAQAQSGYALLAFVAMLTAAATVVAVGQLSASLAISTYEQREALRSLADARRALIAQALIEDNTPGSLPCPDVNNDGQSDAAGCAKTPTELLGCLPWKTLGLESALQSSNGPIWYAVSAAFRNRAPTHNRGISEDRINLDNRGSLGVYASDGSVTQAVAVLISSGKRLDLASNSASICTPGGASAYLDSTTVAGSSVSNADGDTYFVAAAYGENFNDTVMPLTADQLYKPILQRVLQQFAQRDDGLGVLRYFNNQDAGIAPLLQIDNYSKAANNRQASMILDRTNAPGGPTCFDAMFVADGGPWELNYFSGAAMPPRQCPVVVKRSTNSAPDYLPAGGQCAIASVPADDPQPLSQQSNHPASWLCHNDWFKFIEYAHDGPNSAQLKLRLDARDDLSYECMLQVTRGAAPDPIICRQPG